MESAELDFFEHPGVIPIFPPIMVQLEPNSTQCICSDLQTEDYSPIYAWFNWVLIIICLPSLSCFGICTNIINVYVYTRKRMHGSANIYLLFLSCSDFFVILTGLFIFWIDSARSYIQELSRAPYTTVYTLPFGYMAQTCSIYCTVAAAVDCYINVCWSSLRHKYCTEKTAKKILAYIVILSVLYNSLRFPQFNLRKCFHEGSKETVIEICPTTLFFTVNTIYNVYMYMVLMTLLPFFFLLLLNVFIIVKTNASEPEIDSSSISNSLNPEKLTEDASNEAAVSSDDTIVMIAVVLLFLCCNTLALVVNVIETFFEPDALLLNMLTDTSNFLVILNSSVNCIIYLVFNKEYRAIFLEKWDKMKCRCCLTSRQRNSSLYKFPNDEKTKMESVSLMNYSSRIVDGQFSYSNTIPSTSLDSDVQSPIWQKKQSNNADNYWTTTNYRSPSFQPNHSDILLMDDDNADSGWGDDGASNQGTRSTRWLAEVKITENRGLRPQIYVKPISRYSNLNMSVTAL